MASFNRQWVRKVGAILISLLEMPLDVVSLKSLWQFAKIETVTANFCMVQVGKLSFLKISSLKA